MTPNRISKIDTFLAALKVFLEDMTTPGHATEAPKLATPPQQTFGLLTEKQLAAKLGLHPATLRNWSTLRKGPPRVKIGKAIFYREDALNAWIMSREGKYGAEKAGRIGKKR